MSADVGCSSRSAAGKATSELSRCFASLGLASKKSSSPNTNGTSGARQASEGGGGISSPIQPRQMGTIIRDKIRSFTRQAQASQQPHTSTETTKHIMNGIRKKNSVVTNGHFHLSNRLRPQKPLTLTDLWRDEEFLNKFFRQFNNRDLCVLAQVCVKWRDVLYTNVSLWGNMVPVLHCRQLRCGGDLNATGELRKRFYVSLSRRNFDSICLFKANDEDIYDFLSNYSPGMYCLISFKLALLWSHRIYSSMFFYFLWLKN